MRAVRTLTPAEEMRIVTGVAVQPFVAGLTAVCAFPLLTAGRDAADVAASRAPHLSANGAGSVAFATGVVALFVAAVAAAPIAVWLLKRRGVSLVEALAFGVGLGDFVFAIGEVLIGRNGVVGIVRGAAFSALIGLSGAAVFWEIALRSRDGSPHR